MAPEDFKRKITAVFSADVVGYSRLMGEDESATVKTLETYKGVMFSLIKQHRGRVVDSPGDNLLAELTTGTPKNSLRLSRSMFTPRCLVSSHIFRATTTGIFLSSSCKVR